MNKRIKGHRYNTDASQLVGNSGTEFLYRKSTGAYFIYNSEIVIENESVTDLDITSAKKWVREKLGPEVFLKQFAEVSQEYVTRLSAENNTKGTAYANYFGVAKNKIVNIAMELLTLEQLQEYFDKK